MKMTREEAFEMLKERKVYACGLTDEVQVILFNIGFKWNVSGIQIMPYEYIIIGRDGLLKTCETYDYFSNVSSGVEIPISKILNIELEPECEFKQDAIDNTMLDAIDEFNSALDNAVNNIKDAMEKAIMSSLISNSIKKLSDDISKIKEILNK